MKSKSDMDQEQKPFPGELEQSNFWCNKQNKHFFKRMDWHKLKTIDWEFDKTNKATFWGEVKKLTVDVFKNNGIFSTVSNYQESDLRNKNENFKIHILVPREGFFFGHRWKNWTVFSGEKWIPNDFQY